MKIENQSLSVSKYRSFLRPPIRYAKGIGRDITESFRTDLFEPNFRTKFSIWSIKSIPLISK